MKEKHYQINLKHLEELINSAIAPTVKKLREFNEDKIKSIAQTLASFNIEFKNEYKAFNIANKLVKELIEQEDKEICIITTEQFDIDNIITTLEFIELCKSYNKEVKHTALLSYKDNNIKLSKSLKNRDLNEISFYALDCEVRLKKYNAYNIHNHLNELEFNKHNISANCFMFNKFKCYNHITDIKQGISAAMNVISSKTSKDRVDFISRADSCGYSIFLTDYAQKRGFKYNKLFEYEKFKYTCYYDFKNKVQSLKKNLNNTFKNSFKDNYYKIVIKNIDSCNLSKSELNIMLEYSKFIEGEYFINDSFKSKKTYIQFISKSVDELVENQLKKLNISREEVVNISLIEIKDGDRYIRTQYVIDKEKQAARERAELAEMIDKIS